MLSKSGNSPAAAKLIQELVSLEPSLIAFCGKDCAELENICDDFIVGDGQGPIKEITTTSHPDEPFEDVTNMVELWDMAEFGKAFELIKI